MGIWDWVKQPWPWYVAGPLLGLMVPLLLILGNKSFGVSSSLRHICAAILPAKIPFFNYDWKKETWNLFFVTGIIGGAAISILWLMTGEPVKVDARLVSSLQQYNVTDYSTLIPADLFNWQSLFTARGIILMVVGGFLVGFGTRYAGGCTSGHAIMGLSALQWPSLIATCSFMLGGFITANLILPFVLQL